MAKLSQREIRDRALRLLDQEPGGLRWAEVLRLIARESPDTPGGTIRGAVRLAFRDNELVVKVARGTYQLARYYHAQSAETVAKDEAAAAEPWRGRAAATGEPRHVLRQPDAPPPAGRVASAVRHAVRLTRRPLADATGLAGSGTRC